MKTMLEALDERMKAATETGAFREGPPLAHVTIAGPCVGEPDEGLYHVAIEQVGTDFIQVKGRMIDRDEIREIQPVNF